MRQKSASNALLALRDSLGILCDAKTSVANLEYRENYFACQPLGDLVVRRQKRVKSENDASEPALRPSADLLGRCDQGKLDLHSSYLAYASSVFLSRVRAN